MTKFRVYTSAAHLNWDCMLTHAKHRFLATFLLLCALIAGSIAQSAPAAKPVAREEKPRISEQEAQELFRSVDSMLKWVSNETRLPIKHPVKRELASRAAVEHLLTDRLQTDEDAQRLKRSELVLKKFGLLPREFDLESFMVDLLKEQVAGFYDPKKQTVFLLNWVEPDSQKPVLAHELTHALQDQSIHLDKWMRDRAEVYVPADKPAANAFRAKDDKKAEKEQRELERLIAVDEIQTARQAVTEGQGMAVLVDYSLEPMHRSITDSPELVQAMRDSMGNDQESPLFDKAPRFIKEALTFPYRYGLSFVQTVWIRRGREAAFKGALEEPPSTSREIMEPETYVRREHIPPLGVARIPALLGEGWERFDVGAMGEFDSLLLLEQYTSERVAKRLAEKWRGGYYYAAHKKDAKALEGVAETATVDLLYCSRWASARDAAEFAAEYAKGLPKRYRSVTPASDSTGNTHWQTEEGEIVIEATGDVVVITESFEPELGAKLRGAAFAAAQPASSQ